MITDGLCTAFTTHVTGVTLASGARQTARQPLNPWRTDSGPAQPFGDLVELLTREHQVLLKKYLDHVEKGYRVGRRQGVLHASLDHTVLLRRFDIGDGTVPSQCCEKLLQLQQLFWFDYRETDAHAQERVDDANRARGLNPDTDRLEHKVHFRADGKRSVHFHVASLHADVGEGRRHADVGDGRWERHPGRTANPGACAPLVPRGAVHIGL